MMVEKRKIAEIASILKTGKTPPSKEEKYYGGEILWFTPGDLNGVKLLKESQRTISTEAVTDKKATIFPKNTLIISCIGDIGKIGIATEQCSSNQQLTGIYPKDILDVHYLYYWFYSNKEKISSVANNAVVPILNNKQLGNIDIVYPPLPEQQRIAAMLDAADAYRQKTKALIAKYDELAQSIFLDMFGDPVKNEKGWEVKPIEEVSLKITDGEHGTVKRLTVGKMYLMARNIQNDQLFLNDISYISEEDHNRIYKRCNPQTGDILLVCVGATIGKLCIVPEMEEFSLARSVALIKPNDDLVNGIFLIHFLRTPFAQANMSKSGNSSAQAGLYTGQIKKLKILNPPLTLQNQFAERIEALEAQKAQAQAALVKAEELFGSLLQESFGS